MSNFNEITCIHVEKLGHVLEEIRVRALENIIAKLDRGGNCTCVSVTSELIIRLFHWFHFQIVPCPEKVLNLLYKIITTNLLNLQNLVNLQLKNELFNLKQKLDPIWHSKVHKIEEVLQQQINLPINNNECTEKKENTQTFSNNLSPNTTIDLDCTLPPNSETPILRKIDRTVRWLVMPWQPLILSDRGVLSAIEEALNSSADPNLTIRTCQFVTNVMLQDFPAEVFLQRPSIVRILLSLLETCTDTTWSITPMILRTLCKLTRSLRFRIYYYCDPCIANRRQKELGSTMNRQNSYSEDRGSSEGGVLEVNYQAYQSIAPSERSQSIFNAVDESMLQLQQMLIPTYCIETFNHVLRMLFPMYNTIRPLKNIKIMLDLSFELVQLLTLSVMPSIWLCNDNVSLKIHESLKQLLYTFADILQHLGTLSAVNSCRATYLQLICIITKFLSSLVPLELADIILPPSLKLWICTAIVDAPLYLMYPQVHSIFVEYSRQFHDERDHVKTFEDTRLIAKSMEAAISLLKSNLNDQNVSETLRMMYLSKTSLPYHRNFSIIKKYMSILQNLSFTSGNEDEMLGKKILLYLLSNSDDDISLAAYRECHWLVTVTLGVEPSPKFHSWMSVAFLFNSNILVEMICHGVAGENAKIKPLAEDILIYILKGKVQIGDSGWKRLLDQFIPVFPLLHCLATTKSSLGQCISQMLDPDIYKDIPLSHLEVFKGNICLMFSRDGETREEASRRLIYLLTEEKNSQQKLPRLASLHGLPLGSIFVLPQPSSRRFEGNYQENSLTSVLELLQMPNVEPKVRKSALVQISVMMSDESLHKIFTNDNMLKIILEIFEQSLVEKNFQNYPDSVIPIITIIRLIATTQEIVRQNLSTRIDVFVNIMRSVFLFPNNNIVKINASELLFILLFNDYIVQLPTDVGQTNISLPNIAIKTLNCPLITEIHWISSINRKNHVFSLSSRFLRQFWCWNWNNHTEILSSNWKNTIDIDINENLRIEASELAILRYTSIIQCCQQQLENIQRSNSHEDVANALDYLWMYLRTSERQNLPIKSILTSMSWLPALERFLLSHPASTDDCELFVDVLNFFNVYISTTKDSQMVQWFAKIIQSMSKSLADDLLCQDVHQDIHQAALKLIRACSTLDDQEQTTCSDFIELIVSNLCSSDQQHFYNLVYLDWLLTCLVQLTRKFGWPSQELLLRLVTALIELVISFHCNGAVSFMGLSITRNAVICLNHVLPHLYTLSRSSWQAIWFEEPRTLSWLPHLWRNRDPLVRASALQLFAGLIWLPHRASQLVQALVIAPHEIYHILLMLLINHEESCLVKEQACIALTTLVKNSSVKSFQYTDSLDLKVIVDYFEEQNVYFEVNQLCANVYLAKSLDPNLKIDGISGLEADTTNEMAFIPKNVLRFYDCYDEMMEETMENNCSQFLSTPKLISKICRLFCTLINVEKSVADKIYEYSLDKYLIACFGIVSPDEIMNCDVLEMYKGICRVLTHCLIHSKDFASIVNFSPDFLNRLFIYLNVNLELKPMKKFISLRLRLIEEIYNFISALSLTQNGHFDVLKMAMDLYGPETIVKFICNAINHSNDALMMSAITCLAFLVSQDIERDYQSDVMSLSILLDTVQFTATDQDEKMERNLLANTTVAIGFEISNKLIDLLIAYNYAKMKENFQMTRNKDLIVGALTNLLCVSHEAKKAAIERNLSKICLLALKELYTEINLQPIVTRKLDGDRAKKVLPLLSDIESILALLMNFTFNSLVAKSVLAQSSIADVLHKLWAWICLKNSTLVAALKLMATFTTNCPEGALSLALTTALPSAGPRKTPNNISLIHVIIQLISGDIEKVGHVFHNERLHFAFHLLKNTTHVHECRVLIAKSDLLNFFTKIHPTTTKRAKPWPFVEAYCLEFLINYTFYEEGQQSVSKAVDGLDVLIHLSRCNTATTRILALSTLRNVVFHVSNRPRILSSVDFANLLNATFKSGNLSEISIAASMMWSLVANNQKGKLMARTTGLVKNIQEGLSRITLLKTPEEKKEEEELTKMLQYILRII